MFYKKKKILTVGAYERDNFGDLLFFLLLKHILGRKYEFIAGSTISKSSHNPLGVQIFNYGDILKTGEYDYVWIVGGEIGGVSVESAIKMNYGDQPDHSKQREAAINKIKNSASIAYLPEISKVKTKVKIIVNSVGLSGLDYVDIAARKQAYKTLTSSDYVSVRDPNSYRLLRLNKIKTRLYPDFIHLISHYFNQLPKPNGLPEKYITVQLSEEIASKYKLDSIAKILSSLSTESKSKIVFFVAGTAYGHDSLSVYNKLTQLVPNSTIFESRDPFLLAGVIKHSNMWIGSSLHGRIIAASYGIRRISIRKEKIDNYASTWDRTQPYGIDVVDTLDAYRQALETTNTTLKDEADRLTYLAKENLKNINRILSSKNKEWDTGL